MHSSFNWCFDFFAGDRLKAEVKLHSACYLSQSFDLLTSEQSQLSRAAGLTVVNDTGSFVVDCFKFDSLDYLDSKFQSAGSDKYKLLALIKNAPFYPDPLLLWIHTFLFPCKVTKTDRHLLLQRAGSLLQERFPQRIDLLYSLVAVENVNEVVTFLSDNFMPATAFYSNTQPALFYLHSLWAKGKFNQLLLEYVHYQSTGRHFESSDCVLRCYTIIGAIDRVDLLFRDIYRRYNLQLQPVTLSNMIFTALGLEALNQAYVDQLIEHWRRLTRPAISFQAQQPLKVCLEINEKPVLVVFSADLRMHPVGRFWLPLAQQLATQFKLIHLGFNPHDQDPIRDQLKSCSAEWHLFETSASVDIDALLMRLQPDLLLDLGGHTADNRPGLLNQRFAAVQATYLGFYGPTYAEQCDWWILDAAIAHRVQHSYPGSENIWQLDAPSLCYNPVDHGLPAVDQIIYSEADHPIIGSFNHTRKLTSACIKRFGAILQAQPEAVLQFRSHSFFDPNVRRWFLQQFIDAGIAAHQLQPLPYAPSGEDALKDYGRIHLHLDSYPVSGTTTTLDSLAMGIPVLSCPNHLYAGAISAAILEQAGLDFMICDDPAELPHKAKELAIRYRSANARRELAQYIRNSAICDINHTPKKFANQLLKMLKYKSTSNQIF